MVNNKSPNELWRELDATIERHQKPKKCRKITLPCGLSFCAVQPRHRNEIRLAEKLLAEI